MNSQEVLGNGISLSVFFQYVLLCVLFAWIHLWHNIPFKLSYLFLSISKAPVHLKLLHGKDSKSLQN